MEARPSFLNAANASSINTSGQLFFFGWLWACAAVEMNRMKVLAVAAALDKSRVVF